MSKSILLVQLADIGDLILTTPAIAALRGAYPASHITLLTTPLAAQVINKGLVDEIITLDKNLLRPGAIWKPPVLLQIIKLLRYLRRYKFDTVVYFHHLTLSLGTLKFALIGYGANIPQRVGLDNGKGYFLTDRLVDEGFGARHQAQYWLDLVGLLGADTTPRPAYVEVRTVDIPLPERRGASYRVVIHAGSGGYSQARRWSPEKFATVADRLMDRYDVEVVLVGTADDDGERVSQLMRNRPINLIGKTTLAQLAAVLQKSDLYLGADSGVMHLAAAVGIPVLAIFGPSNHRAWGPWTPNGTSLVIRSDVGCSPCSYVEHGIGLREGCPARTCMKLISVNQVLGAARSLLHDVHIRKASKPRKHKLITDSVKQVRLNRIQILGLPVDKITYDDWMTLIGRWVREESRCHHVCTTNPEFIMIARRDPNFRNILKRADLCIPDGVGLLWAAKHKGTPLPERVTGSDGVPMIAEFAAKNGWRLFFLGAAEGIAEKAAQILCEKHPGLQIVGTYAGTPSAEEEDAIVEKINASEADILLVAYGAPQQDKWIARNNTRLNVKMAMGVGGSFDFIAGVIPRAPGWMRAAGLEWLFRLIRQPWRIGRMMRLPRFVWAVLRNR